MGQLAAQGAVQTRGLSKGLEELGLELIQLERVWARLGPCGDADGLKAAWPNSHVCSWHQMSFLP